MTGRRAKQPDPMILAPAWGSLWGVAFGTWALIPSIISAHHIRVEHAGQWGVLLFGLVVIFALIGAFLGFVGGFVLTVVEQLVLGSFRDRVWAYALLTSVVVIAGYGLQDYAIETVTYRSSRVPALYLDEVKALALLAVVTAACAIGAYWIVTRAAKRLRPRLLVVALLAVGVTGAAAAVTRSAVERLPNANVGSLVRRDDSSTSVPLLFVGIDGATWRVLEPVMQSGGAPTLRAIRDRGTYGDIEALWRPYWSGAAWASIITGLPRETTGIYEDLAAIAPGLPPFQVALFASLKLNAIYTARQYLRDAGVISFVRPPRALLRGKPVWQLLHEAGVNSAVLRFPFTYPPSGQAEIVVSDWVGRDAWEDMGVQHRTTSDAVTPPELANQLLAPFQPDAGDPHLFERLVGERAPRKPADAVLDPFEYLRASADVDERMFEVSSVVLKRNPKQPFLAIYVGGLDSAEHAFWQYRFPEEYAANPPAEEDVKRFAPVIDRYVKFIDERLRVLLTMYQEEPNIVIVSDHGQGASQIPAGWRGWHTKDGVFLAAGPSVPTRTEPVKMSYYDVLPTLVSLEGFTAPAGLTGRPLFDGKRGSTR